MRKKNNTREPAALLYKKFRRPRKGGVYWLDARIHGARYRESLETRDTAEANEKMLKRVEQLKNQSPDPHKVGKNFSNLTIEQACEAYIELRKNHVSPRMVAFWRECASALGKSIKVKVKAVTTAHIAAYQSEQLSLGVAPKTVNGRIGTLRQLLKHAKRWDRIKDEYRPLPKTAPNIGYAPTDNEMQALVLTAKSRTEWQRTLTATILGAFCGMRSVEIRHLRWMDVDFDNAILHIRRSKTPAGHRSPSLNYICKEALESLYEQAKEAGFAEPQHYVFPAHKGGKTDYSRPAKGWRTSWRTLRRKAATNDQGKVIYPALLTVRFHDLRHYAVTVMAEAGLPDQVILGQVGHIDPEMLRHYSHVRRQAFNQAAQVLEPRFLHAVTVPETAPEMVN